MIRYVLLCLVTFLSYSSYSQFNAAQINKDSLRLPAKINGRVVEAWTWNDKNGKNILVLTETDVRASTNPACDDCSEKELYVYHFAGGAQLWRVMDYVRECQFDLLLDFRKGSVRITDLDKDGIAETWFMYRLVCTSDVSPSDLKLIMHEGAKKYAVRGRSQFSREALDPNDQAYEPDAAFKKLSRVYRDYAAKLWEAFLYDN